MKVVLVWDPRFLAQKAARLMLDDRLASAAVRAGVAAAADPAEQADLAAGAPLDPGSLTDAIVQHGPAKRPVRIVLPASVIAVGVALGIAAAASGPPIPGDTAPVFTVAPAIAPTSGTSSTTFTATDGTVSNGTLTGRRWLLNGTAIGTGTTVVPGATGSLVLENTATGPGGTTTATSSTVTVSAVPAPSFTAPPSISPSSGDSATTFTATDGTASNGSVTARRWLLSGTAIGTGVTVVPGATGSLVLENTATGPGGTATATSSAVTVTAAPAPLLSSINADGITGEYAIPANLPAITYTPASEMASLPLDQQRFQVVRSGFDSSGNTTSYTEWRYCTKRKRQTWSAGLPDTNHPPATASTVCLDDTVYATDNPGSGLTNNSTLLSPTPACFWLTPARQTVNNSVYAELSVWHRDGRNGRQCAFVRARANSAAGATPWSSFTTTTLTANTAVEDANPVEAIAITIALTAIPDGTDFWLEAEVYPWIGDSRSIARSEDNYAAGVGQRAFTRRYYRKDSTRVTAPPLAYISSAGSDATGVWSATDATARATPFLTLTGAISKAAAASGGYIDGMRIRLMNTVTVGAVAIGTAPTCRGGSLIIERDPTVTRAQGYINFAANLNPNMGIAAGLGTGLEPCVTINDCSFERTNNSYSLRGQSAGVPTHYQFWNVAFKDASGTFGTPYINAHASYFGLVLDPASTNMPWWVGNQTYQVRATRGMKGDFKSASNIGCYIMVGCDLANLSGPIPQAPTTEGFIMYNNTFLKASGTPTEIAASGLVQGDVLQGYVIVQNLVEQIGTGTNPHMRLSADNNFGSYNHIVVCHNTIAGIQNARTNFCYDEGAGTNRRQHTYIRSRANIHPQINVKGDVFVANGQSNPTEAPNRTGHFMYMNGTGVQGDWTMFCSADGAAAGSSFSPMHGGQGTSLGTSLTVRNDPLFVNYQGTTNGPVAGAGGGDYHLQAGSPARGIVDQRTLRYDIAGAARPTSGNDSCGAYA